MNAFKDMKATEMTDELITESYVNPVCVDKIINNKSIYIKGLRGSGKTHLLRYLHNNPVRNKENNEIQYLGVYYRFLPTLYANIAFLQSGEELFCHLFTLELLIGIIQQYKTFFTNKAPFKALSKVIGTVFYEDSLELRSYDNVIEYLNTARLQTVKYLRNKNKVDEPMICAYDVALKTISNIFTDETEKKDFTIMLLLDEFENLNIIQQKSINSFVKSTEYNYCFKIAHRPDGIQTNTIRDTEESINPMHDIIALDFHDDIIGEGEEKGRYKTFVQTLCNRRLDIFKKSNPEIKNVPTDIKECLQKNTLEEEINIYQCEAENKGYASKIRKSLIAISEKISSKNTKEFINKYIRDCNIVEIRFLLAILNKNSGNELEVLENFKVKNEKYENYRHNYFQATIFLICNEMNIDIVYSGFETIVELSGTVIRYCVNILYYLFGKFSGKSDDLYFTDKEQTIAINNLATNYVDSTHSIERYGGELRILTDYLGSVFNLYHMDPQIKKWEVNHFRIREKYIEKDINYDRIGKVKNLLTVASINGFLLRIPVTKEPQRSVFTPYSSSYKLHPILCPHYKISYRQKKDAEFSYSELYEFIYSKVSKQQELFREKYRSIISPVTEESMEQLTLYDSEEG